MPKRPTYRPPPVFRDGVHHVQQAAVKDKHPLQWLIGSAEDADIKTRRRAATQEEAIEIAKHLTKVAIARSKNDRGLFDSHTSDRDQIEENGAAREAKRKTTHIRFATTHFICIRANPTAQVWQCVSYPGEQGTPGRRPKKGQVKETSFKHQKGECSVLLWRDPLLDDQGQIKVFPNWQEAEEQARALYEAAYEEGDVVEWYDDWTRVERLTDVEILFDPAVNGDTRPFSLWFWKAHKPHYRAPRTTHKITNAHNADGSAFNVAGLDREGRSAHEFNRKMERMAQQESNRVRMTEELMVFKTIWAAEEEAIRLEREYFGNGDLYP